VAIYLFGNTRLSAEDDGFVSALATAHADHLRPKCTCLVEGTEMYVARLAGTNDGFIVKRMPNTGSRHAPDCLSYEPPPELSGLGQVLGTAIIEDPVTGETALKLGFPMSKMGGRPTIPAPGSPSDSVACDGTKLSLRGLLHYLWDQADLTRWQPGFSGKRSWGTVRRHLLLAAENKIARGCALRSRLYVPEVFSVEQRDAISTRRIGQWGHAVAAPGKPQNLMLLVAEVKEIVPARYGFKAVIKHVPDQAFALDEQLYRRLGRRFETELALWGSAGNVHMIAIATFGVSNAGIPAIAEMSLMPVTPQWLPIEDSFDRQLVDRLVSDGRSFIKGLRYNLPLGHLFASATLTDADGSAPMLFIAPRGFDESELIRSSKELAIGSGSACWVWVPGNEAMPLLPGCRAHTQPSQGDDRSSQDGDGNSIATCR
jgi:hypothetical protein